MSEATSAPMKRYGITLKTISGTVGNAYVIKECSSMAQAFLYAKDLATNLNAVLPSQWEVLEIEEV